MMTEKEQKSSSSDQEREMHSKSLAVLKGLSKLDPSWGIEHEILKKGLIKMGKIKES